VHVLCLYDYAIVRIVPRVERQEFINAGVIVACQQHGFLDAGIELDEQRVRALDPASDLAAIRAHLASIPVICRGGPAAGPIGRLTQRERFHWLVAPRSTMIQTSPVHTGRCLDPQETLQRLLITMVREVGSRESSRSGQSGVGSRESGDSESER